MFTILILIFIVFNNSINILILFFDKIWLEKIILIF